MSEQPAQETADRVIAFGPFRLLSGQRLLLEDNAPVRLGSRACDILLALLEKPGHIVTKQELLTRVWPDTFVEEASIRVHVAALRRALGDGNAGRRFITNVPGRGYSFVAPVSVSKEQPKSRPAPTQTARHPDIPVPLARMVGRSDVISTISEQLSRDRFVTIVGPGGIGKTTVALAVTTQVLRNFTDGVHFIDFAPLADPQRVPSTLAARLGIPVHAKDPIPSLLAFLEERSVLIVLDSCEHLIEAVATLAEGVFNHTRVHILATSREALRAEGEHVYRLPTLSSPSANESLNASDAISYPSVQLFVDRAAASSGSFELSDADAPIVAEICHRLDGIPLAIEIAASRVDTFGVAGLAAGLNDRFQLLMQGRRTALPRHRTLGATLDWSYSQLLEIEALVLRRLAVFVGSFTMAEASAVLAKADIAPAVIIDAIANLVAKSLVWADVGGPVAFYRLFDVTRAYALTKLEERGEGDSIARAHADYFNRALEQAQGEWETLPAAQWLQRYRHIVDNVRVALEWSFSPKGDSATGIAITVGAVPLWFELSLTSECAERVDLALTALSAGNNAESEMRLHAARAWSLMQTQGALPATQAAWTRVLEISEQQGDVDYQLRALWGLWSGLLNRNEFRAALELAERFSELARKHTRNADALVGERMTGYIVHLMGDQSKARKHLESMLSGYVTPVTGAQMIRFVFDQRAIAQCFLARILWLQGSGDQAVRLTKEIVETAVSRDDTLSLFQTLVQGACPVALLVGDLEALENYVAMLLDYSQRQALVFWRAFGRCFESVLYIRRGQLADGLNKLAVAIEGLREIKFGVHYSVFLAEFADALACAGRVDEAHRAIGEALDRADRNEEHWYKPELLRIKGEVFLREARPNAWQEAEKYFGESLDLARRQETIAWQLRAATSLAKVHLAQSNPTKARNILAPVYAGFSEGHETADLREAKKLLDFVTPTARPGRRPTRRS